MTYQEALYYSPRQVAYRHKQAVVREAERQALGAMYRHYLASLQAERRQHTEQLCSPLLDQPTIHLAVIQCWQPEPTRDTDGVIPRMYSREMQP